MLFRSTSPFFIGNRHVRPGTVVRSDDPILVGRASLFAPYEPGIEQATSAPGEKRNAAIPPTSRRKRADQRKV